MITNVESQNSLNISSGHPGIFGYNIMGSKGSNGKRGFSIYYTNISDEDKILSRIKEDKILISTLDNSLEGYQVGDYIISNNNDCFMISRVGDSASIINIGKLLISDVFTSTNIASSEGFIRYMNSPGKFIDNYKTGRESISLNDKPIYTCKICDFSKITYNDNTDVDPDGNSTTPVHSLAMSLSNFSMLFHKTNNTKKLILHTPDDLTMDFSKFIMNVDPKEYFIYKKHKESLSEIVPEDLTNFSLLSHVNTNNNGILVGSNITINLYSFLSRTLIENKKLLDNLRVNIIMHETVIYERIDVVPMAYNSERVWVPIIEYKDGAWIKPNYCAISNLKITQDQITLSIPLNTTFIYLEFIDTRNGMKKCTTPKSLKN